MMEVNHGNRVGVKPEKKKPHLNLAVGGVGIGGLVLLGGGLAVAALVAAFTVVKKKKNTRRYDTNEQPTITDNDNEKREASRGLSFVLQAPPETPVNQNPCCTSHEEASTVGDTVTYIDSCELVSAHSLILEDKPVPIIIGDGIENPDTSNEEIFLSDGWSKESHISSYDILGTEEFSLPAPDDEEPENVIKNDSVKGFQFMGTTAVMKENEAVDAEREENLPMLSVEEGENGVSGDIIDEEEEDDDDDDVNEENVIEEPEGKFAVEENLTTQEMLLPDDSDEESIVAGDDILCNEGSSLAVPDGPSLDEPENMINNDSGENLQYTETIQVVKEDETVNTDKLVLEENSPVQSIEDNSCEEQVIQKEEERLEGRLAVEDNLPMQSVEDLEKETEDDNNEEHVSDSETEEEVSQEKLAADENSATQHVEEGEGDDDDGDDSGEEEEVTEEGEDSSEGTGSSSMESNVEAIWPAEIIDAPSQGLKEMNVNYQNIGDKIADDDRIAKAGNYDLVDCQSDGKYDSKERGSNNETTQHSRMMLNKKAAQELVTDTVNDLMVHSSKRRVWIWSMLVVVVLLLLLLIVYRTAVLQDLPYHDNVIVP